MHRSRTPPGLELELGFRVLTYGFGLMVQGCVGFDIRPCAQVENAAGTMSWWVELMIDAYFWTDIVLNFRTGVYTALPPLWVPESTRHMQTTANGTGPSHPSPDGVRCRECFGSTFRPKPGWLECLRNTSRQHHAE